MKHKRNFTNGEIIGMFFLVVLLIVGLSIYFYQQIESLNNRIRSMDSDLADAKYELSKLKYGFYPSLNDLISKYSKSGSADFLAWCSNNSYKYNFGCFSLGNNSNRMYVNVAICKPIFDNNSCNYDTPCYICRDESNWRDYEND